MKALEKQLAAQWVWTGAAALLQTGSKVLHDLDYKLQRDEKRMVLPAYYLHSWC